MLEFEWPEGGSISTAEDIDTINNMRVNHGEYNIFIADGVTKFLILFKQYRDLDTFAHTLEMLASNDRYSSIFTPRSLKLVSSPCS